MRQAGDLRNEKGFTLVELSIVLVIIGLLAGGILVAQSMIATARINGFVKQIQQYDIAVSNFKTRYSCLPGDCKSFGGDQNGFINDPVPNDDFFAGEIANFWNELSTIGLIKDGKIYSTDASTGVRAGVNVPKAVIGNNGSVVAACEWDTLGQTFAGGEEDYPDWRGKNYNYYHIYNSAGFTTNSLNPGVTEADYFLSPVYALAADAKMDDSNPTTGLVRASGIAQNQAYYPAGNATFNISAEGGAGCVVSTDLGKWNLKSTAKNPCALVIVMLSQVGQN